MSPVDEDSSVEPLGVRVVENGVVYPTIRIPSHPGKLLMGVYDGDNSYVEGTVLDRRAGEQGAPVPRELFPSVTESEVPEAIYGGPLYVHYGHFLLESLARAWYAHQHPEVPFVWAGAHTWQGFELLPWQAELLDILEITNPTRIIADPVRFERLYVPDIGYRYEDKFHPEHAAFLGRYEGPSQIPGHRLWLSRSKVQSNARDLNSAATERRLAYAGWTVARPEVLSVRQQLDHLARASIVAGEEGSAFHSVILLKNIAAKKFHVFRRSGREHRTYHTIGDARRVDQCFYTLERERVLTAQGRFVSKLNPNSSEILDILDVPVPTAAEAITTAIGDAALARALTTLRPQKLLDVGNPDPSVIVSSTAPTRVAVCPRFDFDPRSYAASGVDFYELELARYADTFHEDGPFDVIRLAGSTFDDIITSFRASKALADARTVWILGSGEAAAKAALAIRLAHPGYLAKRLFVTSTTVYLAQRAPGEPVNEAEVGQLSAAEVTKRLRSLPLAAKSDRPYSGFARSLHPRRVPSLFGPFSRMTRL